LRLFTLDAIVEAPPEETAPLSAPHLPLLENGWDFGIFFAL